MDIVRITKEFSFEMAHTLTGYDGACSEIHGHSYRLFVTVSGRPCDDPANPKYGMVIDFRQLKKIVSDTITGPYDHSMMIRRTSTNGALIEALGREFSRLHTVDYQPTCENLITEFAHALAGEMPEGVRLHSLRLHETATSFAEWFADDNVRQ